MQYRQYSCYHHLITAESADADYAGVVQETGTEPGRL